ncbi:Putative resolvase/recombinase domain protein (plasmid) [Candidatus Bandiella woodruffii]|uniref:Resolvase/recombinase domain protein n=2 Tax=Candidatus Bandiella euplotis TaxID=1664265 RepID=A0ABZ0UMX3_9RICK|nr:Putative resolvase/recombinase domain protein [Candidatus Bandiella woodruffii]
MRTKSGLEAALAKGRQGGRPKGLTKKAQEKACAAETLYKEDKFSTRKLAAHLGISRATLYSYLKFRNVPIGLENNSSKS